MPAAPVPENEDARLASLRSLRVLDTPPEDRFDRVVRLLARLLGVPMAFVSLVDADRQWFKASCGLNADQTPRSAALCAHAILARNGDALVVRDAASDPRFRDSPLVKGEPGIRFYAGQPLAGPGGHRVGTLCVADRRPRDLSADDRQALRDFAAVVERELNLAEAVQLQGELLAAREEAAQAQRQRAESLERVVEGREHLVRELRQAADYVASLLPAP